MHPQSQVLGVDLSPVQPDFVPPNLSFQIDDIEEPWTYRQKFDFIYSRMMVGSLANVPRFFEQSFENLAPGGVLEMADITYPAKLNGGDIPEDLQLYKWSILFTEACTKAGRNANCARLYRSQMETAGFTTVVEKTLMWPTNRWPKDKKLKEIGMWALENMEYGLEALSTSLFTRVLGWEKEELNAFLVGVRREMRDTRFHTYWDIIVVMVRSLSRHFPERRCSTQYADIRVISTCFLGESRSTSEFQARSISEGRAHRRWGNTGYYIKPLAISCFGNELSSRREKK
ncbi:S-adenosyl-L-methionine-dependent methyltransferase [Cadophora sp. MPI-SDFR-AT-0126]|nr:S-adenosyl-L-methionine-dependent methyltransferase [Leotiomycetes sp. MPI-SDFR-AT-0126]